MTAGRVETAALTRALGVTEMTIRRDLSRLQADGALRRVRSGATRTLDGAYEPPFGVRARLRTEQKDAIARVVVSHIHDGETIVLDGGTTGLAIAKHLLTKLTTVCSLSIRAVSILVDSRTARVLAPGGLIRPGEQTFVGPETVQALCSRSFDTFIMTASGVSSQAGFTEWNEEDAAVKRAAIANCGRCIAACDSSKFGHAAFARVAAISDAEVLVTDESIDPQIRRELEELGTPVEVAALLSARPSTVASN